MADQITDLKNQIDQAAEVGPKIQASLAEAIKAEQQSQNVLADAVSARKKAEIALASAEMVESRAQEAMANATANRVSWDQRAKALTDSVTSLTSILEHLKNLAG
jgi:hypothetical protein